MAFWTQPPDPKTYKGRPRAYLVELVQWLRAFVAAFNAQGQRRQPLFLAKSPAGGIASGGSGNCTLVTFNGTAYSDGSETLTVYNPYPSAVGASKRMWCCWWEGVAHVVTEAC